MPRLPYADADQLGEMLRQSPFSEDTPPGNVFRMLAQAPPVGAAALGLIYAVLSEADLDPRVREMVILRVAEPSAAPYAFAQHAAIAASVGVAAAQVAELERGHAPSELFDEPERAALAFADLVLDEPRVSAETFARLGQYLTSRQMVELLLTAGCFRMMSRLVTVFELELEPAFGVEALRKARTPSLQT
jgi:4-carboxymuconolactone decarboxylase